VTVAHALGALTALAVAPLAPFLLESLELTRVQAGLFLPAVYLGGVLMALPAGWFTDRLGVRRVDRPGQPLVGVAAQQQQPAARRRLGARFAHAVRSQREGDSGESGSSGSSTDR